MNLESSPPRSNISESVSTQSVLQGYRFELGSFNVCVQSALPTVINHLRLFYPEYKTASADTFTDFYITLKKPGNLRNWLYPQVVFEFDEYAPFRPLPLNQAPAQFEWGLNWCIASQSHQYLIVHSAVVEKDACCLLLPGNPGSGKSTLCAGLVANGWRLLSDEMALVQLEDLAVQPVPRPISLKNGSIGVIRPYFSASDFGTVIPDTVKGELVHLRAPLDAIQRQQDQARVSHIVFPRYMANATTDLQLKEKAVACLGIIENCFNFNILGTRGFEACGELIDSASCHDLTYSNLDDAIDNINQLVGFE